MLWFVKVRLGLKKERENWHDIFYFYIQNSIILYWDISFHRLSLALNPLASIGNTFFSLLLLLFFFLPKFCDIFMDFNPPFPGITIETRPDYCLKRHLSDMLKYGCTRLEIGVQSVYEDVARDTNRYKSHIVGEFCVVILLCT